MQIIKHYYRDDTLRQSFNALAEDTFGLNFENWYRNGFWNNCYDPYSVVEDGRVVANVSVNRTDLMMDGQLRRVYQLGTVMTAPEYRNRGYIRAIMSEIEKDISDGEGVYLFANDAVLEFYPKFGFRRGKETVFSRTVEQTAPCTMEQIPMDGPAAWAKLDVAMRESVPFSACEMVGNPGLIFFYAAQFLREDVYYSRALDAWAIAEREGEHLLLHSVFSRKPQHLTDVIGAFGPEVKQVTLGFTPLETEGFTARTLEEPDCTFFVKGPVFRTFGEKQLRIPTLSHA